jgi:hypothetical protein
MARPDQLSVRLARVEALLRSLGLGSASTSVGDASTLEGHPASYFAVAGALAALSESASAPPAASSTYLGQFYLYRPAATSGQLLICQRDSAGGYEWTVVAQASL